MRLALVADLHGNWPATQAMDRELKRLCAEDIWFVGDAVGKGPDSALTCDWVMENCSRCIGGNWDYGIGGKHYPADQYYWDQLGPERMKWLRELPDEMNFWFSGIHFRMFHGRPVHELMKVTTEREVLEATFRYNGCYTGVIFADSHRPFVRTLTTGYILNTGSVGNSTGVPNAHALLLEGEPDGREKGPLLMTVLSVPYDTGEAVRRAEADPELPHKEAWIREITTGVYSR